MYIGSVESEVMGAWVLSGDDAIERRDISYVPGLFKIIDEILMNAVDHSVRTSSNVKHEKTKRISVNIDRDTGVIRVENDGEGIPVQEHVQHACYVPELIFGHMLTSANYDDAVEKTVGGQNGIGAKACNVFSKWFEVETVDASRSLKYRQKYTENMSIIGPPSITKVTKSSKSYTSVTFLPDYAKFGVENLSDDMYALVKRRVYDVTAVTNKDVVVHFNDVKLVYKTFERYCDLYLGDKLQSGRVYDTAGEWEVVVSLSSISHQQVSFVNGVATLRGGRHVDHVTNTLTKKLVEMFESKVKIVPKSNFIKDNLFVLLKATVPNPTFDSQSKETLTTPVNKLQCPLKFEEKFISNVYKLPGLVDRVVNLSENLTEKNLKKTDGSKRSTITGIPKLDDAEWAGGAKSDQCTLILTEGDSAKAMAVAGLTVVGRQKYGIYPLRGKVLNVCEVTSKRIADNAEIANLKKIIGLQVGRTYSDRKELRYGRVMILADADLDGSHIKGLVMNLFLQQWPSLMLFDNFLVTMLTPIVKVHVDKTSLNFYNVSDFQAWTSSRSSSSSSTKYKYKYYKGLGTSTAEEAREYFADMKVVTYKWDDGSHDRLDLAFNKKRPDDRKQWLAEGLTRANSLDTTVTFGDFVDKELKEFSLYDLARSIPSVIDGFKVSQRKVIYAAFKRKLTEGIRVAQLTGYTSEHAAYHHGEASLHGTIVNLAQDYVGSNNVNLLEPVGQFGTRLAGGADSASPRYIHTHLAKVTRYLYPAADDCILKYMEDDGVPVEPEYYVPIIPMVLVNGAMGIGTGYSTSVPCYNPKEVVAMVRAKIKERSDVLNPTLLNPTLLNPTVLNPTLLPAVLPAVPWHRGFKGNTVELEAGKYTTRGILRVVGEKKIRVTELPIGLWTYDFKAALEVLIDKYPEVKSYTNNSSNVSVDFTVTFATREAANAWYTCDASNFSKFEVETKMNSGSRYLSTTNMHLFDASGKIKKYGDVSEIVSEFVSVRYTHYVLRKAREIETLSHDALFLAEKARFISSVVDGSIVLHEMTADDVIYSVLRNLNFATFDGNYKYLLNMPLSSLSIDKRNALTAEVEKTRQAIEHLEGKSIEKMWTDDLDAFEKVL